MTRRVISVFLAVIMIFSLAVSVCAANEVIRDQIVNETEFNVTTYEDANTITMIVPIEDYPELAGSDMIYDVALALYSKQNEMADDSYVRMSLPRIAGELALHVMLFRFSYILGGSSESSPLHEYYLSSKDAEININEERLDSSFIDTVGVIIIGFKVGFANSGSTIL